MRDSFFQIVLSLAGVAIGITALLLPRKGQKWVAVLSAVLLVLISLVWAGYELGVAETAPTDPVPTASTELTEITLLPAETPTS